MDRFLRFFIGRRIPLLVFILIIFISGVGFGAIAVNTVSYTAKQDLFNYFNDFLKGFGQIDYQKSTLMNKSVKFNLLNVFMIWIFGISVVVMPVVPILVFFKGFVLGFTIGLLVNDFAFKGLILAVLTVFPQNILIVPVYILAGLSAISFSLHIIKYYRGRERLVFNDFINYSSHMFILAIIILGGSLMETYVSPYLFQIVARYF